jgi:MT0933-like antitoxin protein
MSEFMDEAKKLASEHSEQADEGLDKAAEMAGDKTGGKYDSQIQTGEDKVEGYLGVQDQDNQGNQDSGQGN